MQNELDGLLIKHGIGSGAARALFIENATIRTLHKNEMVFAENKLNNHEYMLLSGVLHRFHWSEKGAMITTGFYMQDAVITPHFARTIDKKSLFSLQSLTETTIASIAVDKLDDFRSKHVEFQRFGQRVVETELSSMFLAETVYRSYAAKERLLLLREQFPNLENMIPHAVIASFLGITQVSFSRLRRELTSV